MSEPIIIRVAMVILAVIMVAFLVAIVQVWRAKKRSAALKLAFTAYALAAIIILGALLWRLCLILQALPL